MRLPRPLHPGAWWLWALGLATAASRRRNPRLLALVVAVAGYVVAARRTRAPWARAFDPRSSSARSSSSSGWRSRSCSAPTPARTSWSTCRRSRCRTGRPASTSADR